MITAHKYDPKAAGSKADPPVEKPKVNVGSRVAGIFWNGYGRQLMTVCTTVTITLAALGGITAILENGTMAGWLVTIIVFANLIGTIGVAKLSWKFFGWEYRKPD